MKSLIIGLTFGIIIAIWSFYYFFYHLPNISLSTSAPTPIISIFPSITPTGIQSNNNQKADLEAIRQAYAQKYGRKVTDVELSTSQQDDSHFWGTVKFRLAMEGGWILAAKAADQWVVVQDGNGTISCEAISPYNFPKTMVSECVNKSGKLVKL